MRRCAPGHRNDEVMGKRELTFEPHEIGGHVREMKGSNGLMYRPVPVTGIKSLDDPNFPMGTVQAFVSVTGIEDDVQDIIEPGAYGKTLATRKPKGVWSHDWDTWVAKTLSAIELTPNSSDLPMEVKSLGGGALFVTAQFNLNTTAGRDAYENVKFFEDDCEWSIGYNVPPGGATYDQKSGIRHIKELELFEYSPVLFGAMSMTSTLAVKSRVQREHIRLLDIKEQERDDHGRFGHGDGGASNDSGSANEHVADAAADARAQARAASEPDAEQFHRDRASALTQVAKRDAQGQSPAAIRDALTGSDQSEGHNQGVNEGVALLEAHGKKSVPMMTPTDEKKTHADLTDLHSKVARAKQSGSAEAARSLGTAIDHTEAAIDHGEKEAHPEAQKSWSRAGAHADNAADSLGDNPLGNAASDLAERLHDHAKSHLIAVVPGTPSARPLETGKSKTQPEGGHAVSVCEKCKEEIKTAEDEKGALVSCPNMGHSADTFSCPDCDGTNKVTAAKAEEITARAEEKASDAPAAESDDPPSGKEKCPTCNGDGKLGAKVCPTCAGTGWVEKDDSGDREKSEKATDVRATLEQIDALVDSLVGALGIPAGDSKGLASDRVKDALQKLDSEKAADTTSSTEVKKAPVSSENDTLSEEEMMEFDLLRMRS